MRTSGRGHFCFRCEAYATFVVRSRIGNTTFAWTRRLRKCHACGASWWTVEVPHPADPTLADLRAAARWLEQAAETSTDLGPLTTLSDAAPLNWQEARTWR